MSGKGSKRRPEDKKKIDANWDRIFAKPKPKLKDEPARLYTQTREREK